MFKINARTVLELGAELISSDIVAFYELIKNAFDAGSRTGADVKFCVVLRRNEYLANRNMAQSLAEHLPKKPKSPSEHPEVGTATGGAVRTSSVPIPGENMSPLAARIPSPFQCLSA